MVKSIKIAFNERTNGIASDVEVSETGDSVNGETLLEETRVLSEKAQTIAQEMSALKQMKNLR
jgi:hypothetical protein